MWSIGLCYRANTSVSEEPRVPLLLFSISSPRGGGFCSTDSCFYSQHNIIHSALPQSPEDCRGVDALARPDVMRMERNGRRGAPLESLFPFQWRASVLTTSPQNGRERGPFISISHALIYISYIYIYTPCCFVLEEEKTILQNTYLWRPDCIFLFSVLCPLWCLPNTVDLKRGEKSDDPSLPSPPFSFKSNQVNEDVSFYMND